MVTRSPSHSHLHPTRPHPHSREGVGDGRGALSAEMARVSGRWLRAWVVDQLASRQDQGKIRHRWLLGCHETPLSLGHTV